MGQPSKEPCKKQACDIQSCLSKNNFLSQKCFRRAPDEVLNLVLLPFVQVCFLIILSFIPSFNIDLLKVNFHIVDSSQHFFLLSSVLYDCMHGEHVINYAVLHLS
ncbi:hypothetical protein ACP275_02G073000 [Erythranthe tilingii]